MNISSSTAGLYPVPLPAARRSVAAVSDKTVISGASSSVEESSRQAAGERTPEHLLAADINIAEKGVGELTQKLSGLLNRNAGESAVENSVTSAAQRAVAEYANVATQEHREELVSLLGIDVFA